MRKTGFGVFDQFLHNPGCRAISDLGSRGIVISVRRKESADQLCGYRKLVWRGSFYDLTSYENKSIASSQME